MCKECEKRATTMRSGPPKRHISSISSATIEELCQWFRAGQIDIVEVNFEAEDITVTIGLESEIAMLEAALLIPYRPSRDAKLEELITGLIK